MKISAPLIMLLAATLTGGCLFHRPKPPRPIVTPDHSLTAKVVTYNSVGRFVVLTFPVGQMPKMDQTLFLYRNGLKVGEIKITGPRQDNYIVADLISGDAQADDEVRSQ